MLNLKTFKLEFDIYNIYFWERKNIYKIISGANPEIFLAVFWKIKEIFRRGWYFNTQITPWIRPWRL